jgi:hypothetical protein
VPPTEPHTPDDPGFELVDDPPTARRRPVAYPFDADERMRLWTRGFLVALALGFATIFAIGVYLNPYQADGTPKTMGTHQGLGLPPCNMVQLIGKPCPSCGMTTSFSLLMHGDPVNSVKANWAGTVLALVWLALIPWAVVSAVRGKYLFVRSGELLATVLVIVMLVLMLGRWAVVLLE